MSHVNIADYLADMARRQPHTMAVVFPEGQDAAGRVKYTHYTYAQLDAACDEIARGLERFGIGRGTRTVLMAPPSLDFFALVFALFRLRAVLVCVDPGLGIKHLGKCLAEAAPTAFVGVAKAHWARRILGWSRATIRHNIVVGRGGWSCGPSLRAIAGLGRAAPTDEHGDSAALAEHHVESDAGTAAILFTSGSTGTPKGVVYTHQHFDAQLRALRDTFDIQPGEIDLATFPLFALYAPALGMTAIVPEMDFTRPGQVDPCKIARAIDDFGVTNLFGSPALLDRVSRWGEAEGRRFSTLRRVISAGAPVPARVIERMTKLLADGVQVFTPYGATESLPVASIGSREILADTRWQTEQGRGICVGRPVGDVQVRVAPISDAPIERWRDEMSALPGTIGEIIVSGPAVTANYHARDEANRLAKIADANVPSGFWHRMGDLGYFDEQGRLWFCGRKSQRLTTADSDRYTIPCEGIFNAHADVRRTALVGVPVVTAEKASDSPNRNSANNPSNGRVVMKPVLCVELREDVRRPPETIREELLRLGEQHAQTRDIRDILFHPAFPVDIRHNAKIGREELGRWAARKLRGI